MSPTGSMRLGLVVNSFKDFQKRIHKGHLPSYQNYESNIFNCHGFFVWSCTIDYCIPFGDMILDHR